MGNVPPKTREEKTNDPHPYGKSWHVRIVDVGNRSSDLWIWTIFLLKGIEIEFHPMGRISGRRMECGRHTLWMSCQFQGQWQRSLTEQWMSAAFRGVEYYDAYNLGGFENW